MLFSLHHSHPWAVTPQAGIALQKSLAEHVREMPLPASIKTIAGVDVSVRGNRVQTAIVVLRLTDLVCVDQAIWQDEVAFPYVPGLLSFREMPAILPALEKLKVRPDVWMTDSHGYAHPRRFGLACHLGVLLDQPAFGVAKKRFIGTHTPVALENGAQSVLAHQDEPIGVVLRSRSHVKPIYVSIGHRITLPEAVALTQRCLTRYRLPEPTRQAHLLSKNQNP